MTTYPNSTEGPTYYEQPDNIKELLDEITLELSYIKKRLDNIEERIKPVENLIPDGK